MYDRDNLLNDIYFKIDIQENLAKKYEKTPSYVSQLAKQLRQLRHKPVIKNDKLVCVHCLKSETNLTFHHNHETNQLIALVCQLCNLKLKNKDLNGEIMYNEDFYGKVINADRIKTEEGKVGRPIGMNFKFIKTIKLNQKQTENWDPKYIRACLNLRKDTETYLDNKSILKEMFEKGILKVYEDKLTEEYKTFLEAI